MRIRPLRPLTLVLVLICAACAGAFTGMAISDSPRPATASTQALAYFDAMLRAADSTGLEQAACVSGWTFRLQNGKLAMHVERVRPALVHWAEAERVRFECYENEGTVHTHALVCRPSQTDREGWEMFGVVICPNPTRFAVFAVMPPSVPQR